MSLTRRTFLRSIAMGSSLAVLDPLTRRIAHAARKGDPDHRFIFCYFSGGWDTLLLSDPRDPNKKYDKIDVGYDRLDGSRYPKTITQPSGSKIQFGPGFAPFARHYDVTCAVNGVQMETVSHAAGRLYFITGKKARGLSANGSSVPSLLVAQQGPKGVIPNLTSRVATFSVNLPAFATGLAVTSATDLRNTLRDGPQAPDKVLRPLIEAYRADARQVCDPVVAALDRDGLAALARSSQQRARLMVKQDLGRYFDFMNTRDPEMAALKARYRITSTTSPGAHAAMAWQAIRYGISQVVSIQPASGLDTHANWAGLHPGRLQSAWTALATLVDDLKKTPHPKGGRWIDKTTIVCFSEFGRTPRINTRQGRDHAPHNSAILIGAKVPHNKVVGATSDVGLVPMPVDAQTGAPVKSGGVIIKPTQLWASVLKATGFDYDVFRVDGLPCLMG